MRKSHWMIHWLCFFVTWSYLVFAFTDGLNNGKVEGIWLWIWRLVSEVWTGHVGCHYGPVGASRELLVGCCGTAVVVQLKGRGVRHCLIKQRENTRHCVYKQRERTRVLEIRTVFDLRGEGRGRAREAWRPGQQTRASDLLFSQTFFASCSYCGYQ